ncbi:MAG: hypothetical protein EOO45_04335 [Flavobacterium sp.]|nr:MAG: hypothetical protein EOO45_04335 [Flavobacterium sp.]
MKRILSCLLLLSILATGCKKEDQANNDPLYKRWFVYKIEKHYTDKSGNPDRNFKAWSNIIDDRQMFFEFKQQGRFSTYQGTGSYQRYNQTISYTLAENAGEYQYRLQGNLLLLSFVIENTGYNELVSFEMRPF